MEDPLLASLTAPQREAVLHVDGPLLILAGPGSGKTRVVTHRIAHLLREGVHPRQLVALTFTNKAAEEMRKRVEQLAPGRSVWMSTFHRFCARLLREYAPLVGLEANFTIYDVDDAQKTLKRAIEALDFDPSHYTPQQIATAISHAKNDLRTPETFQPRVGSPLGHVVSVVYPKYQELLLRSNAVDFDDLLLHVACLLRDQGEVRSALDARFRYVLIDEYQDTNLAQYTIARALSIDYPNLAVTGDPDQSIYGWRGANLRNILEFERDYPAVKVVRLEQNYRSTKRILRVAQTLIERNRRRKAKGLFTENDEGSPVRLVNYPTQKDEAEGIAAQIETLIRSGRRHPRDIAIFYRVNALSRALESALREHGIPYHLIHSVEFFQRKEIKDAVAYLGLLNNPRDNAAFLRIINTPSRGIGKATLERLTEHAETRGLPLLAAAREAGLIESLPKASTLKLAKFVSLFDRLAIVAAGPVEEILGHVLAESGYRDALQFSEDETDQDRLANIEELLTAAREFDEQHPGEGHLEEFLEQVCLVNDTDDWDSVEDRVTLMTLHASKGLEFPVVFITAVEEGLIPHERSETADQIEEERRLLFVGLTRAEEELQLSWVRFREFRGMRRYVVPSSFLLELPREEMDCQDAIESAAETHDFQGFDDPPAIDDLPVFSEPAVEAIPAAPLARGLGKLTTAAALAGREAAAAPVSPEMFALGMTVLHPEYGLGKIVSLSGRDQQRRGTIEFAAPIGQRTFMLAQSKLLPVASR